MSGNHTDGPRVRRDRTQLGQVVRDLGVGNDTWWGIALHFVFDSIRFPYTAIGYRYDLNHGQWHGPDSGISLAIRSGIYF